MHANIHVLALTHKDIKVPGMSDKVKGLVECNVARLYLSAKES